MTVIVQELYNALKEVGASEETARSAAEALTGYGDKFHDLEREIDSRFNDVDNRFNELEREIDSRFNSVDNRFNELKREMDQRFNGLEREMDRRFSTMEINTEQRFSRIEGTQKLHNWMMGFQIALIIAVLFLLLRAGI